ncbi:MAG: thiosulfate oxidation carrier complex protein SoxZ [Hyphomicrobiaceae bacterium]
MAVKPRIKLPARAKVGEVIEIKTLVSHVMETGQRRDQDGKVIPRMIIHTFTAKYDDKPLLEAKLWPGTSANPYFQFFMKVPGPGSFEFTWVDDAGTVINEKVELNVE